MDRLTPRDIRGLIADCQAGRLDDCGSRRAPCFPAIPRSSLCRAFSALRGPDKSDSTKPSAAIGAHWGSMPPTSTRSAISAPLGAARAASTRRSPAIEPLSILRPTSPTRTTISAAFARNRPLRRRGGELSPRLATRSPAGGGALQSRRHAAQSGTARRGHRQLSTRHSRRITSLRRTIRALRSQAVGQVRSGSRSYRKAGEIKPAYAAAPDNLGNALRRLGQLDAAHASFRDAAAAKTDYTEAYFNLHALLLDPPTYDRRSRPRSGTNATISTSNCTRHAARIFGVTRIEPMTSLPPRSSRQHRRLGMRRWFHQPAAASARRREHRHVVRTASGR